MLISVHAKRRVQAGFFLLVSGRGGRTSFSFALEVLLICPESGQRGDTCGKTAAQDALGVCPVRGVLYGGFIHSGADHVRLDAL